MGENCLSNFISAAKNLRFLIVRIEDSANFGLKLSQLAGEHVWPHLHEVVLDRQGAAEDDLILDWRCMSIHFGSFARPNGFQE